VARLQRKRFTESDDVRVVPRGRIDVVELDDQVVGLIQWDPGWRWSVDLKPTAGTQTCQFHHLGYAISGRLRVQMQDGVELELGPGDIFEIPPGHDAWVVGDEPYISVDFEAMRDFARPKQVSGRRSLGSLLITDIVDSTARAVEMGPGRWRDLVSQHNKLAERVIEQHGGRLVKTTGDGVIGFFDSSERAIDAARTLIGVLDKLKISIRAAVETGEMELANDDVRGIAVHAAARMMALAQPGEVVVSSTVRHLLEGTDLAFEDYGLHDLKGMPGQRQLYRLVRPT
jgi:class 3 adenylate cyclase